MARKVVLALLVLAVSERAASEASEISRNYHGEKPRFHILPRASEDSEEVKNALSLRPKGHPDPEFHDVAGIPQGCITYEERYKNVRPLANSTLMDDPNDRNADAKLALVFKIHHTIQWHEDLVLWFLAAAEEANAAGINTYLLLQDSRAENPEADDTPVKFRHRTPHSLRPLLLIYDETDVHNLYPRAHAYVDNARDYLSFTYFMHRFPGYDFCYFVEFDVRYTGPEFGTYLQALLKAAMRKVKSEALESPAKQHRKLLSADPNESDEHIEVSVKESQYYPDLLLVMSGIGGGDYNHSDASAGRPRDAELWNLTNFHYTGIQLMGWSRSYGNTLHAWSTEAVGGYIEEFIPSMAIEAHHTIVSVPIALYYGDSFFCCDRHQTAERYYEEFHRYRGCRAYALLHPVKLDSSYWSNQPLTSESILT